MAVSVLLAGVSQVMKTTPRSGEHIPHHISQPPEDEVTLLTAASTTGSWIDWPGGQGMWFVRGTFGGATLQLQISDDGGTTPLDIDGAVLTSNGGFTMALPAYKIRAVITGGSGVSVTSKMKQC